MKTVQRVAWRSTLIAAVVIALLAVAVNLPMKYVETGVSGGGVLFVDFNPHNAQLPLMAGWPFRYSIYYEASGNLPELSVFSASALLRNIGLTLGLMALVCFYVYRRGRNAPVKGSKRFRVTIGDLLVLTTLVAFPFGCWQWIGRSSKQTQELVSTLARSDGWIGQSSWVPEVLRSRLPSTLISHLRGIRTVRLENPDAETLRLAAQIPTLTSFRVGGGNYKLADLQPLRRAVHLRELRIAGRELDSETIQLIAALQRLYSLNLMRTNVTAEAVNAFGNLPDLRKLNLMHTDVQVSELGKPGWADTLEQIVLPHPENGESDQLTIEGWPNLQTVVISEYDSQLNPKTMKVRLVDLPKLQLIALDQFQKFDLHLSNLPSLTKIEGNLLNWEARLPRGGAVPGQTWLERFSGSDLPELAEFKFFCVDLKALT